MPPSKGKAREEAHLRQGLIVGAGVRQVRIAAADFHAGLRGHEGVARSIVKAKQPGDARVGADAKAAAVLVGVTQFAVEPRGQIRSNERFL